MSAMFALSFSPRTQIFGQQRSEIFAPANLLLLLLSHFSCVRLCATPWTAAHQTSPSMGFSRQEHWSGLPFPSPLTNLDSILKSRDICQQSPYSQSCSFSRSHVWKWELNHKEGWGLKNWYFLIVALEKTGESPLDSKEFKPVNPKWNQPWIFIGRIDAGA